MQLHYRLTSEDYLEAQALHARGSGFRLILRLVIYYASPALGIFHWIVVFTAARADRSARFDWAGFALGAFWIALPLLYRWLLIVQFRRTRTSSADSSLSFDSDLVHCEGQYTKSDIAWNAFRRFSENKSTFLLYMAPGKFLVIPKRACTGEQINELRELFLQKIGS